MITVSWPDVSIWKKSDGQDDELSVCDVEIPHANIEVTLEVEINECNGEIFFTLLSSDHLDLVELKMIQRDLGYPAENHGFTFIKRFGDGNKIIHKWSCKL